MSVLTSIDGIPLFSTQQEALDWASSRRLTGFHTHVYRNITGYMGGVNHSNATTGRFINTRTPQPIPTRSSGGGGSGGGY